MLPSPFLYKAQMTQDQYNEIIKVLKALQARIVKKYDRPVEFFNDEAYVLAEKYDMGQAFPLSGTVFVAMPRLKSRKFFIVSALGWLKTGKNINLVDFGNRAIGVSSSAGVQVTKPTQSATTFMQQLASIPQINAILSDPTFLG